MAACTACMAAKSKQHSGWVGNIPGHDIAAWWAGNEPQVTSFCENTLVPRMALQANRGTHTSLHRHRGLHWHTHKGCIGTEAMRPTEAHAQRQHWHRGTEAMRGMAYTQRLALAQRRGTEGMAHAQRLGSCTGAYAQRQKGAERAWQGHKGRQAQRGRKEQRGTGAQWRTRGRRA